MTLEIAKEFIKKEALLPNKSKVKIKDIRQVDDFILAYFGNNGVINFSILRDPETGVFLENLDKNN